jgi:hypothetical protein
VVDWKVCNDVPVSIPELRCSLDREVVLLGVYLLGAQDLSHPAGQHKGVGAAIAQKKKKKMGREA